ncbi:MAG TPA: hypothetical protein VF572_02105 [Candidatus Saccharimonadales bacterium]
METKLKQKETLGRKASRLAGQLAVAGVLIATAANVMPNLPARGPDPDEDCVGKLDRITQVYDREFHQTKELSYYKAARMTGKAACTNVYWNFNRRGDDDGSFVKHYKIEIGEEAPLCYDAEFPDQLQIENSREFKAPRYYVNMSPDLQRQVERNKIDIPAC